MTEASAKIPVDLTNPGQFFACCGLLELAGRLDLSTMAYFEPTCFVIGADVPRMLHAFFQCEITVEAKEVSDDEEDGNDGQPDVDAHRGRTYPMILGDPFHLRLDWWTTKVAQEQKLKTWTAGQRVTDLLREHHEKRKRRGNIEFDRLPSMRDHFAASVTANGTDWLRAAEPIRTPAAFNFDSRTSRNNALDLGFPNTVADSMFAFSPAVEVLTLLGLQRFRPVTVETWTRNRYFIWDRPLPVEVSAVAALGLIPHVTTKCFEFPVLRRDAQGRFKLFGHAQPVRSQND